MPTGDYLLRLRERIGHDLLLLQAAAGVVQDGAGRVLLQLRSDNGQWGLPGGAIDPAETPAQAVVREVEEETGLHVRPERLLGVTGPRIVCYPNGDRVSYTSVVFSCTILGGALTAPPGGESVELRFSPLTELPDSPMLQPYPLLRLLEPGAPAWFEPAEPPARDNVEGRHRA